MSISYSAESQCRGRSIGFTTGMNGSWISDFSVTGKFITSMLLHQLRVKTVMGCGGRWWCLHGFPVKVGGFKALKTKKDMHKEEEIHTDGKHTPTSSFQRTIITLVLIWLILTK